MNREALPSGTGVWRLAVGLILVVFIFGVYVDINAVRSSLSGFDWRMFVVALGLTLGNQILRFLKWEYLLRQLNIDVPISSSAVIFGSALLMIVSPGKLGEAWKSWLLRDRHGVTLARSLPVVATERLTDLLGVSALAIIGAYAFNRSLAMVFVLLGMVVAGVVVLRSRRFCGWCFDRIETVPIDAVSTRVSHIRELYDASYELLEARILLLTTGLSVVSWGLECLGLWVIVRGIGAEISVLKSVLAFAFSSIVGALSLLPGGVGATEGSMALLLTEAGLSREVAVSATLLVRLATLWFSVALSVLVLAFTWLANRERQPYLRYK